MIGHVELSPPDADGSGAYRSHKDFKLRSVFQAVLGIVPGVIVGYEALLRPTSFTGASVPPSAVFDVTQDHDDLVALNRLISELHIANFCALDSKNCWLFLNVSVAVLQDLLDGDESLPAMLEFYGIPSTRVIIEVLESDIADVDDVWNTLAQYRRAGLMIAFDDFGSGHSNLSRIFNFVPDIVKFDLSVVAQGRKKPSLRGAYEHLTAMLHDIGTLVLAEGIESLEDAVFMMNANVDCLQGYWISRPVYSLSPERIAGLVKLLRQAYAESVDASDDLRTHLRVNAEAGLIRAATNYCITGDVRTAAALFFDVAGSARFYVLHEDGSAFASVPKESIADVRVREKLAPLQPSGASGFLHRSYFRNALLEPNKIHFGGPYFSFLDGGSVYVVATGRQVHGKMVVLCGSLTTHGQMSEPPARKAVTPGLESLSTNQGEDIIRTP